MTWENFSSGAELLWENSAPNTKFAAQTIELDLSKYTAIIIKSVYSINATDDSTALFARTMIQVGEKNMIYAPHYIPTQNNWPQIISFRVTTVKENGVVFSTGQVYAPTYNTGNQYAIPRQIYGVKL